ncbi:hypothetical protein Tco_0749601 [Tanacetum coccineum]|uniref:Uncharacterized protein n=1 Tax=Tanacetum coccineum TaxID=301880 RepID=A0ABQ4YZX1_9ASTR
MTPHQPPRAQRHLWLRYGVEGYTKEIVQDYDQRLAMIFSRQVNQVHILDFEGLTKEMRQGLTDRLKMVYTRAEGQVLFTSYAWRRLFETQGLLVMEFILEFFSTYRISDAELGLDAPEKLTATDLFYLRSMDEGMTVNVPYLLAQYIDEGLIRLTLIAHELSVIDMDELVRLRICDRLDDTWAWVALGPERQQVAAARAPEGVKGTPIVDEGVQAILAPVQAPQVPHQAASRTMPQSIMRLEEKVHGLRELG